MERLDRFEAHQLGEANKAFVDKKFRQAESAYAAFLSEFPDSAALPFVILRLGRCLHLDKKRYEAIRTYREVLDYFPNNIRYAAAALFHTGEAHWENGDVEKALRSWITLAEDREYSKQPLAARALNQLGDQFVAEDRWDRAVEYYHQVAVTFQREDRKVFSHARDRLIRYYLRHEPNESKIREFYREVRGFDNRRPRQLPESLDDDRAYWEEINRQVDRHDRFDRDEEKQNQAYFRYWTEQLDNRFPDWDDYHIRLAEHFKKLEANDTLWVKRLDELFERNQKKGDNQRIIRWISLLKNYPKKVEAYYNRLDFSQMDNEAVFDLLQVVFKEVGNDRMASNVFGRLQLDTMGDDFRSRIVAFLAEQEREEMILEVISQYRDGDRALRDLLGYYHNIGETKKGVETARELVVVPEYAEFAYWRMAELLQEDGQYEEAIQAYRMVDDAPSNMWRIADCFQALGEIEQAVSTLRQVENFLEKYQAEAALRIAKVYGRAGQKDQQLAALRAVLSRYPESSQSRSAHTDLEALGYTRLGGGVEEDD
ncbi:MAG: tetratricopeptide repeat protein [Opitutales bacterium]